MILLDTNVLSEPMKPQPERRVLAWFDAQQITTLYISSTALAELLEGVERMPQGKRRDAVANTVQRMLDTLIGPRVLAYDEAAAKYYASSVVTAGRRGLDVKLGDGQIAAVAAVNGFSVATRDITPFVAMGVPVIDPWTYTD
jgi:predicted nucleic acid-binding protein